VNNRKTMCNLLAVGCQKPLDVITKDVQRVKYLQPHEAVEYGLIDRVLQSDSSLPVRPSFIDAMN